MRMQCILWLRGAVWELKCTQELVGKGQTGLIFTYARKRPHVLLQTQGRLHSQRCPESIPLFTLSSHIMSDFPLSPSIISSIFPVGGTLGVLITVSQLGAALYGVTTVQTFIYHQHRERDPKVMRYSIYFLWVIDTFHYICVIDLSYFYCVKNFGNIFGLNALPWTWPAFMVTSAVNEVLIISWYVHRVWKLSRNIWVILLIGVAAVATCVGAMTLSVLSATHPTILTYLQVAQWPMYLWIISQVVSDVTITVFLTTFLLRRKTGFARTGSMINLIISYSISTSFITSATSITVLVTYTTMPGRFYYVGLAALLPKLTLNSLLAMLNTRDFLKGKVYHDNAEPLSIHLSHLPNPSAEAPSDPQTQSIGEIMQLGVHVEKSTIQV
ncbi:hypothetical protein BDW22DRAFT_1360531 [Trametopsis cervina]|nr:hypothetical protein BDW22DRAFT_1360531 [Trametopsis cervina]